MAFTHLELSGGRAKAHLPVSDFVMATTKLIDYSDLYVCLCVCVFSL